MAQPQNGWHQGKANLAICANIQTSIDVKESYFKVPVHMYVYINNIILYIIYYIYILYYIYINIILYILYIIHIILYIYIYIILYIHTDPPITHRNIYNYVYVYIYMHKKRRTWKSPGPPKDPFHPSPGQRCWYRHCSLQFCGRGGTSHRNPQRVTQPPSLGDFVGNWENFDVVLGWNGVGWGRHLL